MAQPIPQTCFLSLPRELRDRIYKEAFPTLMTTFLLEPNQKRRSHPAHLNTSLLRTNKQICSEASAVLYSNTYFGISNPEHQLKWFNTIGNHNVKRLENLRFSVESEYPLANWNERMAWYQLFRFLACKATGLRRILLYLDAEEDDEDIQGAYGAGKDVRFLRELGRLRNLQSITIRGYYGKYWLSYLTENMGITVEEGLRKEEAWEALKRYQLGTEDMIP
ncbi:MAG: hypothetical protein L6R38_007783 [Xanthoria sp. 2 TBL-2021]|nr:MAG: hypothetical protein L6R38_007783 [Xanthoria sp. 2 TBL-2021]